jgi:hypothetical protein
MDCCCADLSAVELAEGTSRARSVSGGGHICQQEAPAYLDPPVQSHLDLVRLPFDRARSGIGKALETVLCTSLATTELLVALPIRRLAFLALKRAEVSGVRR